MYDAKKNSLEEIAAVSCAIGGAFGVALTLLISGCGRYYPLVVVYGMVLPFHFLTEFLTTYWYQQDKVTSRSFVIYGNNGNREFWISQLLCILEFILWRSSWFAQKNLVSTKIIGTLLIVAGLGTRFVAMKTCGESFSHYIEVANRKGHTLVTHGIYSVSRHPSYLGYWIFIVGVQTFLQNPLNGLLDVLILSVFFTRRIRFEEWFLVNRFYGQEYERYKERVGIWIPFVWV